VSDNEIPATAREVPRDEFDRLARAKSFQRGPWISSFGDGPKDHYVPHRNRKVWGVLIGGEPVFAGPVLTPPAPEPQQGEGGGE
jgi:hypothetical protein